MKKITAVAISILLISKCFSQENVKANVIKLLQAKEYNKACSLIDSSINNLIYLNDAEIWHYRGFSYKGIYTTQEKANKESPSRITALQSFKKSIELDTSKSIINQNVTNVNYIVATIYNDVATCLDTINYNSAIRNFELYKKYKVLVDTSKNHIAIQESEIKFKLALAYVYGDLYLKNIRHDIKYYNLAQEQYIEIIAIEKNNKLAKKDLKKLKRWKKFYDKKNKSKKTE